MTFAEIMFYAEEEGRLPTKRGKLNTIIRTIKNYPSTIIDEITFEIIVEYNGLSISDLTSKDLEYIKSHI